jgi:CRISPR-associated protein Csm1
MDENREAERAALAGLSYALSKFDSGFAERMPFSLIKAGDSASQAGNLAIGGESLEEAGAFQIRSIFTLLQLRGQSASSGDLTYLPLKPLSLKENTNHNNTIFPVAAEAPEDARIGRDERLMEVSNGMIALRDIHKNQEDIETYLESLMLLLQGELWCVPSGMHGASLFDYARAAAALTVCLASKGSDPKIATLVGGDISGIQNFIYTITSKGAASALRGRSLYLQLLTDAIARYILRELNLPITNLLFAGGGHFFILARPGVDLKTIRQTISQILLSLHGGELYLALEGVPLEEKDFAGKALSAKWSELSAQLRIAKLRKFSEFGEDLYEWVFEPRRDLGNEEKECAVCGREHPGTKPKNNRNICPQCDSYEDLGKDLRKAQYLRISQIPEQGIRDDSPPGEVETALAYFGVRARLYDSRKKMNEDVKALEEVNRSVVYALRDDVLDDLANEAHTALGRRFFVNVTPVIDRIQELERLRAAKVEDLPDEKDVQSDGGAVKTFSALEHGADSGFKRLGVLRMDVDSMGEIISEGLGEKANLARIANLSFMINLFFEGWAAEVARKYNREGDRDADAVYSIYSGGDDLFFVGAWDRMPELALEIRNDLAKFACHHPGIHASAGIALVGGKYPLYQAAEDAHEALEKSKDRDGKNAITFLGQTMSWEQFANEVKPLADRLKELVKKDLVPRSLVQRLQRFQVKFQEKQEEARLRGEAETKLGDEQVVWGPWNWHAAYYLKRAKVKEDAKEEVESIRNKLGDEQFRAIEWIGLSARWVDLLMR